MRLRASLILIIAILIMAAVAQAQDVNVRTVTVPEYTIIPVVMDNTISSATSRVGDRITAHCYGPNCGGFPVNTVFVGKLTVAQRQEPKAPGRLKLEINSAILPDGTQVALSAMPSTDQGMPRDEIVGKSVKSGSGSTGAAIGGTIGGWAGDWEGAAIGIGAGYLAGKAVEGEYTDVSIPAGSQGYIALRAPVTFQVR